MITMIHALSGKRMSLKDSEAVKKRILERCGWSELVDIPEEEEQPAELPEEAYAAVGIFRALFGGDIPEETEQPNDGYVEQSPQAAQKATEATKPAPKHRRPKKVSNHA